MKGRIALTIDKELIEWIDKTRSYVPRSTYINHILSVFRKIKNGEGMLHEFDSILER